MKSFDNKYGMDFEKAIGLHNQGYLLEAKEIYQNILINDSNNPNVLHLLGLIHAQLDQKEQAIYLINLAIDQNTTNPVYYLNKANLLHELKDFKLAIENFNIAIDLDPELAEAYSNRSLSLQAINDIDGASSSLEKAIILRPDYPEAFSNYGLLLQSQGEFQKAIETFERALVLRPNYAEAIYNKANVLKILNHLKESIESYEKAIELRPNYVEAYLNKGNALLALKSYESAVASYDKAIEIRPEFAEAYCNKGNALLELKQFQLAIDSYDAAIRLKPDYADAYSNKGNGLLELKHYDVAIECYQQALSIRPDFSEAYVNQGVAFLELKRFEEAAESYDKAISLKPDGDYWFGFKLHIKMLMCDWSGFEQNVLELSQKIQKKERASPSFPTLALPISLADHYQVAQTWCLDKYPSSDVLGVINKHPNRAKIRIGYFSADFYNHATAYLIAELLELHDRSKFELFGFSFASRTKDRMYDRVSNAFDQFIDVTNTSDIDVAKLSRELEIDIAVDLKGLTQDTRLGIFSYRAAPIQVSYLGYPGTLGVDYMDYLIADKTVIAPGTESYYSEKIIYMPDSYQVNDRKREISDRNFTRQELGLPDKAFVFCCFNNNYKITPPVFDTWIQILKAVDESVLWLFEDNPKAAENLRKEAQNRGLDPSRLVFAKRMDLPEHLARHRLADLFLDTLPYNAHTTASDALWVGLPVLTCMGDSFASRVAASLLKAVGLPELITETQECYESLAIELAKDPDRLRAIKDELAINRMKAPLFDTPRFTRNLEKAYEVIFERYHVGHTFDHLNIFR